MNVSSTISIEVDFSVESHMILGPKIDSLTENVSFGLALQGSFEQKIFQLALCSGIFSQL